MKNRNIRLPYQDFAVFLIQEWRKIGIEAENRPLETASWFSDGRATGSFEAIMCAQILRTGVIPPTINYEVADPECDLHYVPNVARQRKCRRALSNSLGFGGQNAALVVSRFDERSASVGWGPAA